jgi:sulfatase maturation enzyme AslB (radical SAM superfamily)
VANEADPPPSPGTHRTLVCSPDLRSERIGEALFLLHPLAGTCAIVDPAVAGLLDCFRRPAVVAAVLGERPEWREAADVIDLFADKLFLVPPEHDLRAVYRRKLAAHLGAIPDGGQIESLTLVVNEACNFRCTYCMEASMIERSARVEERSQRMTPALAETALVTYFDLLARHGRRQADVGFSGGEPFLNWPLMRQVLGRAEALGRERGIERVRFGFNTNASRITEQVAAELGRHELGTVTVGLDGPREGNDRVRVMGAGQGTFDEIVVGLGRLRRQLRVPIEVNTVVTDANVATIDGAFVELLRDLGVRSVSIEPDLVRFPDLPIEALCDRFFELRLQGARLGVAVKGHWLKPSAVLASGVGIQTS